MKPAAVMNDDHLLHCVDLPWYKWVFAVSVGGFLTFFLVVFQPFGVTNHDPGFRINLTFLLSMRVSRSLKAAEDYGALIP